ncbi:hypothetical protein ACFOQM_21180 [Paenibacillus sp. GCM10012307]|uniref:Uncharacterized protein n=1 Tax=Paenibacillus roseus TaxID=2798579 RepID=A0A934MSZ6_9BACL|nr:hypothetical protein [Paenibacillus roseus]MBJ6363744.1 hypothetical protein [Paenibacillus roseus]
MSELMTHVKQFYECRKIQLLMLLEEHRLPVELLFYNAYESTQLFYNHIFVQNENRWTFEGSSATRKDIGLFNVRLEDIEITSVEELDIVLPERLESGQFVYIWVNLDYMPHWIFGKDYLEAGAIHSVFLKAMRTDGDKTLYLLEDNYPEFCDYVDSNAIKNAIATGNQEWTHQITLVHLEEWRPQRLPGELAIRFNNWRATLADDFHLYDHIGQLIEEEPEQPKVFYEKLEHTLSLIAGSRYLFNRFLKLAGGPAELITQLDACSQLAERIKNAFAKAVFTGKVKRSKLLPLCYELKRIDMECFQLLASDSFTLDLSALAINPAV